MRSQKDYVIVAIMKRGLPVQSFSNYHFRVSGRFDVRPNDRSLNWHWHDLQTGETGVKPADQFADFIPNYFRIHADPEPPPRPVATRTGWWNCLLRVPNTDEGRAFVKQMRSYATTGAKITIKGRGPRKIHGYPRSYIPLRLAEYFGVYVYKLSPKEWQVEQLKTDNATQRAVADHLRLLISDLKREIDKLGQDISAIRNRKMPRFPVKSRRSITFKKGD